MANTPYSDYNPYGGGNLSPTDFGGTPNVTTQAKDEKASDDSANRSADTNFGTAKPTGTTWYMPVAGMKNAPGNFASGKGNWERGSFGYQKEASKGGHVHTGTDIYANAGSAIVAPVAGTVISRGRGAKSGNFIKIRGTDGIEYYFAHMQEATPWTNGAKIQAGIFIGSVGKTGNASGTTPHLHFAMKKNGRAISPNAFLETGRQQKHTPLSAIPGLNTPEELANWAMEESRRNSIGNQVNADMKGFDFGRIPGLLQDDPVEQDGFGQRFLTATLDAQSRRLSGGERTPIPMMGGVPAMSSAMSASVVEGTTPGGAVQEADAVHPALQREERLESE